MICTNIEKFKYDSKSKDYFSFCDAVYIITVKKDKLTENQKTSIRNIDRCGCGFKTFWCLAKGFKSCDQINAKYNVTYNTYIIAKHALKNKFNNIVIFEDDVVITDDLWYKYDERKEYILDLMENHLNVPLALYLGYLPIYNFKYNNFINRGRYLFTHCYLLNLRGIERIISYKTDMLFRNKWDWGIDYILFFDYKFYTYGIRPNNIFFQKSDKNSRTFKDRIDDNLQSKLVKFTWEIQKKYTGEEYYQYNPKFSPILENIVETYSKSIQLISYLLFLYFSNKLL